MQVDAYDVWVALVEWCGVPGVWVGHGEVVVDPEDPWAQSCNRYDFAAPEVALRAFQEIVSVVTSHPRAHALGELLKLMQTMAAELAQPPFPELLVIEEDSVGVISMVEQEEDGTHA